MSNRILKINDVFKSSGYPEYTYVKRENGKYENQLSSEIESGKICIISGLSKTGKTTLYNEVLKNLNIDILKVSCNKKFKSTDIWKVALEKVNFNRLKQITENNKFTASAGIKFSAETGWSWLAKLRGEANLGLTGEYSESKARERILAEPSPFHLIPILSTFKTILVIEELHYMNKDVVEEIAQDWKEFNDEEIPLIVVETAHHAIDVLEANDDLDLRIFLIEVPIWEKSDLQNIVLNGFKKLNVSIDEKFSEIIAEESVGLPYMTQEICQKIFTQKGIKEVDKKKGHEIDINAHDIKNALYLIAKENLHIYTKYYNILIENINNSSIEYNMYWAILNVLGKKRLKFSFSQNEIEQELNKIDYKSLSKPNKEMVTEALDGIQSIQDKMNFKFIEWNSVEKKLYILKPTFSFYLRWIKNEELFNKIIESKERRLKAERHIK